MATEALGMEGVPKAEEVMDVAEACCEMEEQAEVEVGLVAFARKGKVGAKAVLAVGMHKASAAVMAEEESGEKAAAAEATAAVELVTAGAALEEAAGAAAVRVEEAGAVEGLEEEATAEVEAATARKGGGMACHGNTHHAPSPGRATGCPLTATAQPQTLPRWAPSKARAETGGWTATGIDAQSAPPNATADRRPRWCCRPWCCRVRRPSERQSQHES